MSSPVVSFEPISFAALPGWEADDHAAALSAFNKSCARLVGAAPAPSLPLLPALCEAAAAISPGRRSARAFFERHFVPHRVVHDGPPGLLTGYFEPVLEGSRVRCGPFQTPVLRRPPDLVNLIDETARGTVGQVLTHARLTAGRAVEPFPTRAEIESGALAGQGLEILYLADPVDAFFMHIQGSGCIRLSDGTAVRLTYDGKNGHPYTSIGRYLVETAQMPLEDVTLASLARWLREDPERGRTVMWQNASYVFFRELAGDEASSAQGVLGIPLTAGRSLAVDTSVHALGTPIFVCAPTLWDESQRTPFARLMIAQDVGSAIRGPERGDIYFGSGDDAGRHAGTTKHPGSFYALLPAGSTQGPNV